MRLKEIVAEWLYYTDAKRKPVVTFDKQDSNVRDFYHRSAASELPKLLAGYWSSKRGIFIKIIRGCISDFINSHGNILDKANSESLVKRIISNLRKH